ncbi:hypothetical protein IH982_02430 [Patescibacteria group bacterium]|nr:hypothetical protein [Patescibacteria group bacterium]
MVFHSLISLGIYAERELDKYRIKWYKYTQYEGPNLALDKVGGAPVDAFGVAVLTKGQQGRVFGGPGYRGCSLSVAGRPDVIDIRVRAKGNGITPIAIYGGQPFEYAEDMEFLLQVPVQWKQQGNVWVPHTRERGKDNVDIILLDSNLRFKDVQVSLLSRKGRFYVVVQEVYAGWIRVVEDEVRFVPSNPIYAYPDADYRETWRGMGNVLATMARVVNGVLDTMGGTPLEEPTPAVWEPKEVPNQDGWKRGHVLFFNPITNTGRLLGEDGITYHLFGNDLVGVQGEVHMVAAMAAVYFRPGEQKEGQGYPPVRSCKPA